MLINKRKKYFLKQIPKVGKGQIAVVYICPLLLEIKKNKINSSPEIKLIESLFKSYDLEPVFIPVRYEFDKGISNITKEEINRCKKNIKTALADNKEKHVMILGLELFKKITNKKAEKSQYGEHFKINGVNVVFNYDIEKLFKKSSNIIVFNRIINTYSKLVMNNMVNLKDNNICVITNKNQLSNLHDDIKSKDYVACDIETSGLNPAKSEVWCIGITVSKNKTYFIGKDVIDMYPRILNGILSLPKVNYIWHNGKFDKKMCHFNGMKDIRVDEDTMLMSYSLNENSGIHSLGIASTLILGASEFKSKMNKVFKVITTYADYVENESDFVERVCMDSHYTYHLYETFLDEINNNKDAYHIYYNLLKKINKFLIKMELNGLKIDVEMAKSFIPIYQKEIENLKKEIQEEVQDYWNKENYMIKMKAKSCSDKFNPASPKQVKHLLYNILDIQLDTKDFKDYGKTDIPTLSKVINPPKVLKMILKLRKIIKEYKTYVVSYLDNVDSKGMIYPSFSCTGTATGRTNCSNPNVQNVPSDKTKQICNVRNLIIARKPNRILFEIDYSGAETRCLAYMSQDKALIRATTIGDLHTEVAYSIYGEEFMNLYTSKNKEDKKAAKILRGHAKSVTFGIMYGRGANDMSKQFDKSISECTRWIKVWSESYPDAWRYLKSIEKSLEKGQTLYSVFGRKRNFGFINPKNQRTFKKLCNEGKNFPIQSMSSDNTLFSAIAVQDYLEQKYDAYIVNFIHDSILIDCPNDPDIIDKVCGKVIHTMLTLPREIYGFDVKMKCDIDLDYRWGKVDSYEIKSQKIIKVIEKCQNEKIFQ